MLIRRTVHATLIAGLVILHGCTRGSAASRAPESREALVCLPADTLPDRDPWAVTYDRPVRPLLDSLDAQVSKAQPEDLPALLLARGLAKSVFIASGDADTLYAQARPDEYWRNEAGADWLYNGKDFRDLIKRFPANPLVDDAAYALTRLPIGGECEESVACAVSNGWVPVADFLRAHPNARQADFAVARALDAFRILDSVSDLRVETDAIDPAAIRGMIATLDTVARLQTRPRNTLLLVRAAELWEHVADYDRSRAAYTAALANADTAAHRCIESRLVELPARWFPLDTARVIGPHRVELRWRAPGIGGRGFIVHRSAARFERGVIVAELGLNDSTWIDTTTAPGRTYWYRIAVDPTSGHVQSNPTSATTPTLEVHVQGIAVSTADHRLYVFGRLSDEFPQVLSVSSDGASVERHDGMIVGAGESYRSGHTFDAFASDVWLVDAGGIGVLRIHKTGADLPPALFSALKRGAGFFHPPWDGQPTNLIASVDEAHGAAWVEYRGNVVAMDCVGAAHVCWIGKESEALLRNDSGTVITTVPLPRVEGVGDEFVQAVFAEPSDSSAWLWLSRSGRLLHVARNGNTLSVLRVAGNDEATFTVDRDRHVLWFTRAGSKSADCKAADCGIELVQLDMRSANPEPRVIAGGMPAPARLTPDLNGGVWVQDEQRVRRIDASGRVLFSITLNGR